MNRKPAAETLTITRREAAELTGLSLSSIDRAIGTGQLPAKKYGRRAILLRESVQRFLESLPPPPPRKPR